MKSLTEYITESEQISSDTIAKAAVKSLTELRKLLTTNSFECSKIMKKTDLPDEARGAKVIGGDDSSFEVFKDDTKLGTIYFRNYKLKHYVDREKDVIYQMKFNPSYDIKLDGGYDHYELVGDLYKKKYADENGCKLFANFLFKYIN